MSIDMKFHFTAAARVLVQVYPPPPLPLFAHAVVSTVAAEAKCNWPLS